MEAIRTRKEDKDLAQEGVIRTKQQVANLCFSSGFPVLEVSKTDVLCKVPQMLLFSAVLSMPTAPLQSGFWISFKYQYSLLSLLPLLSMPLDHPSPVSSSTPLNPAYRSPTEFAEYLFDLLL
ncbi:hypothetical protein CRENBAI_000684 [Crenichthys baileyi]|uniref:Uncharacterized protein n=1 Tax=Crenichthys baileyi TaxID=28760 RepID=A0AAV9SMT4_9TELE